jgi:hypothetical protein
MGSRGMVGEDGLSMPVRWADMRSMERVGVRQSSGDDHEAGGQERRCDFHASERGDMTTSDRTTGTRDEHDHVIRQVNGWTRPHL